MTPVRVNRTMLSGLTKVIRTFLSIQLLRLCHFSAFFLTHWGVLPTNEGYSGEVSVGIEESGLGMSYRRPFSHSSLQTVKILKTQPPCGVRLQQELLIDILHAKREMILNIETTV
jgi:hypothetical protein